jgi:cbb3-type cytochrome oxidase maturation protein
MSAIFLLIGISLVVAVGFLVAFLWAVKTNQYEDDYTPSVRMLFNDNTPDINLSEQTNSHRKDPKAQRKDKNKKLSDLAS